MADDQDAASEKSSSLELQRAWALPTLNSNRFILTVWPGTMRMAFGEQVVPGQHPNMHVAVSMRLEDALELASKIQEYALSVNTTETDQDDSSE